MTIPNSVALKTDGRRNGDSNQTGNVTLNHAAESWPSPRAEDPESCGIHPGATDSLTGEMKAFASSVDTPSTLDSSGGTDAPTARGMDWPTPKARDHKGMSQRGIHAPGDALENSAQVFACRSAHQDATTTPHGLDSLLTVWTRPYSPRLSPGFQWWLMRWPHPRAIYCASAGTEWTRWWSRMRSSLAGVLALEGV